MATATADGAGARATAPYSLAACVSCVCLKPVSAKPWQGYYLACEADYWYHNRPGAGVPGDNCTRTGMGVGDAPTDLSNSTGPDIRPSNPSLNGTHVIMNRSDNAFGWGRFLTSSGSLRVLRAHMGVCRIARAANHTKPT